MSFDVADLLFNTQGCSLRRPSVQYFDIDGSLNVILILSVNIEYFHTTLKAHFI